MRIGWRGRDDLCLKSEAILSRCLEKKRWIKSSQSSRDCLENMPQAIISLVEEVVAAHSCGGGSMEGQ